MRPTACGNGQWPKHVQAMEWQSPMISACGPMTYLYVFDMLRFDHPVLIHPHLYSWKHILVSLVY